MEHSNASRMHSARSIPPSWKGVGFAIITDSISVQEELLFVFQQSEEEILTTAMDEHKRSGSRLATGIPITYFVSHAFVALYLSALQPKSPLYWQNQLTWECASLSRPCVSIVCLAAAYMLALRQARRQRSRLCQQIRDPTSNTRGLRRRLYPAWSHHCGGRPRRVRLLPCSKVCSIEALSHMCSMHLSFWCVTFKTRALMS